MRLSPAFSETRVRPSFVRTVPARKPRTECACHPAFSIIAGMVAPLARRSIARSWACFEFNRTARLGCLGRGCFFGPRLGFRDREAALGLAPVGRSVFSTDGLAG